jgi:3-dehydroquinate dehydratase/shikimate dehydrogenase
MLLRQAIVAGFDWVDLEEDVAKEIPRFGSVKRIISYHNFNETPDNLEEIHARMCELDGDVVKLAVAAQSPADNMRLLRIIKNAKKPTVGHCMGEIGFPSRLLSLKFGAPFTYAAFNKERGIAPGLPSFEEIRKIYHVDSINADTQVFGVIGDPVAHSFSPLLHNQMFKQTGFNGVYLPFRVPRGELQNTIKQFDDVPVRGFSVTIPHKEGAAALAVEIDNRVKETSAANTLVRRDNGHHAWNTDYQAALESILANLPVGEDGLKRDLKECHALVLGAGGAARAIAHALHRSGAASVHVCGRTLEKASLLAKEVEGKAHDWAARNAINCDILVNCTPIGMHPNVDESPYHKGALRPGMLVFDTVYNPESTLLIKDARERGCVTVSGVEMFIRQAALQYQFFTGQPASLDQMRSIMRRALSPLTHPKDEPSGT